METVKLSNNLLLTFEPSNKKLRLVITDGLNELACRKETAGKLHRFLTGTESSLFKGRLQLHKSDGYLIIKLKGNIAGRITLHEFTGALSRFE